MKYLEETLKDKGDKAEKIHKNIKALSDGKGSLYKYIIGELPNLLLETILPDIQTEELQGITLKTIDDHFSKIPELLQMDTGISGEYFMENIKKYIFQYFKMMFQECIQRMPFIIDNYNRFIMNESLHIKTMIKMLDGVISEVE